MVLELRVRLNDDGTVDICELDGVKESIAEWCKRTGRALVIALKSREVWDEAVCDWNGNYRHSHRQLEPSVGELGGVEVLPELFVVGQGTGGGPRGG
jgi:hypothetical protein